MHRWIVPMSVMAVMALAACGGGDDDDDGGGSSDGLTMAQASDRMAEVTCERMTTCLGPLFVELMGASDCEASIAASMADGFMAQAERAKEDGTLVYDGAKMQTCLDAMANADCTTLMTADFAEICDAAFEGQVALGGACNISEECAGAARCEVASCPGVCVALAAAGEDCAMPDDCAEGTCLDGTCGAPRADGGDCWWNEDCASGFCNADSVCAPAPQAGSACTDEEDCGDFLTCTEAGTCQSFADLFTGLEGEPCGVFNGCVAGLVCEFAGFDPETWELDGTCVTPTAEAGGACTLSMPEACPAGYTCATEDMSFDGTCTALPTDGQACVGEATCAPGHVCDEGGTCREIGRVGDACSDRSQCYSDACEGGQCVTPICEVQYV